MKERFEELEKLEWAFDVEVDIPEDAVVKDDTPVTTSITEEKEE
jgi:hypothetical protein